VPAFRVSAANLSFLESESSSCLKLAWLILPFKAEIATAKWDS